MKSDLIAFLLFVPVVVALGTLKIEWYARYSSTGVFRSSSSRQFAGVLMSLIATGVYALTGHGKKEWRVTGAVFIFAILSFWATRLLLRWLLRSSEPEATGLTPEQRREGHDFSRAK